MSEYFVGTIGANNQTTFESLTSSEVLDDLQLNTTDSPTFGGLTVQGGSANIILKDTTDNDDHSIQFVNNLGGTDYQIRSKDPNGSGGDGFYLGSHNGTEVGIYSNGTTALTLDASQNATFAGTVATSEITTASGTLTLNPAGTFINLPNGKKLYGANIGFGYQTNAVSAIKFLLGASIDNPDMRIERVSSNLLIQNEVDDGDILFKGSDGGSTITALTLDMSAGGNATFAGSVTATSLIKSGGSSSEFLKADGSVDSSTYASSSALSSYLPLAGGTLTGNVTFPSPDAINFVADSDTGESHGITARRTWKKTVTAGNLQKLGKWTDTEGTVQILITVGSETGGNSGTSTYLWGGGYNSFATGYRRLRPLTDHNGHGNGADNGTNDSWHVYLRQESSFVYSLSVAVPTGANNKNLRVTCVELAGGNNFTDMSSDSALAMSGLTISNSDQFSLNNITASSVTATSLIKSGGTSSQFLKADGSVDGNTYATQSYVSTQVSNLVDSAPAALDTLNELANALGDDASFSTTISTSLGNRLRVDTASQGLSSTQKSNARTNLGLGTAATSASSAFAAASHTQAFSTITSTPTTLAGYGITDAVSSSSLSSHTSATNNPHSVTASQVGAYSSGETATLLAAKAPLASPALTGNPTAPTQSSSENSTKIATTAFVKSQGYITTDNNTFRTVTAGGNTLGSTETLAFTAGSNVTITESAGAVTITAANDNTQLSTAQVRSKISGTGLISYNSSTGVISTTANNYSLPEATATVRGGIELFSNTDQSVAANSVSATAGRTYGIQLNSAGQAVVNVPWSDTNTDTNTFRTVTAGGNTLGSGETLALTAGSNVSISEAGGQVTISSTDTNTVYSHPTHNGDDINIDTGALTGATVISDLDFNITTNSLGHVTDANGTVATRTLTAANLGISAPNAPASASAAIVGNTVEVTFAASTTSNIDAYLVYSSIDGSDYGLISIVPPDDFAASMSIIDNSFDETGTQAYRVYAVKYGILSSATTASVSYTVSSAEPTTMSVVNLNNAYYVQWNPPSSNARFVTAYNVYKHEHATQSSLSRSSASLIYSGMNTNYMYQISGTNNNNFHQFWVETTIA